MASQVHGDFLIDRHGILGHHPVHKHGKSKRGTIREYWASVAASWTVSSALRAVDRWSTAERGLQAQLSVSRPVNGKISTQPARGRWITQLPLQCFARLNCPLTIADVLALGWPLRTGAGTASLGTGAAFGVGELALSGQPSRPLLLAAPGTGAPWPPLVHGHPPQSARRP